MNEEDIINLELMRELGALNKCLFFSEFEENVDLVVPFDTIAFGKDVKHYFGNFNAESLFHESSLPPMVIQALNNVILDRRLKTDMKEVLRSCLYQGSPVNILTPQIQLPI